MSYGRQLLFRWSYRDRLTVLVIAAAVAFLTGAVLLVFAAGTQTAGIAAEFDSPGSVTLQDASGQGPAEADAVVFPITTATVGETSVTVIGVPSTFAREYSHGVSVKGAPPPTLGTIKRSQKRTLKGDEGSTTLAIEPRDRSIFPPQWYVVTPEVARELGTTQALVLHPDSQGTVPLLAALGFFVTGTREALSALAIVALGGGILVAVTVFSVTRMTVRDRLKTIKVIRATGAQPQRVLGLFGVRGTLMTGAGVAVGYAAGVVISSGMVNLGVAVGLPTTLSVRVTEEVLRWLLPAYLLLLGLGGFAGLVAAWPAVRVPPAGIARNQDRRSVRIPAVLQPTILDWRALVPTAATLAAFVSLVVLVAGLAGIAGSISGAGGAVVTEPNAPHPVASQVPQAYADALRSQGINASGEILLFETHGDDAFIARGVNFSAFASLSGATLTQGEKPTATDEIVVGTDLARALDIDVGEELLLGGSTRPGVARPTVVGIYQAPGLADDQALVPLATARRLSGVSPGRVNLVRAERLPTSAAESTVGIMDLQTSSRVIAGETVTATVTLGNDGTSKAKKAITVHYRGERVERVTTVPAGHSEQVTATFESGPPGEYLVRAGSLHRNVSVVARNASDSLVIHSVQTAPPGSAPQLTVTNVSGAPVESATVSIGNQTWQTTADGRARVQLPQSKEEVNVTATADNRSATTTISVEPGATRVLPATLDVRPSEPSLTTRPRTRVKLRNVWNQTLTRSIVISSPGEEIQKTVSIPPGKQSTFSARLARQPPGEYEIRLLSNGTTLATRSYTVTGDERLVSALASSGRARSSGLSQAIDAAFGNLRLVLGALLFLAGGMTVGGTTATFAASVHARRRTIGIHRAAGATRPQLLGRILIDALKVGLPATILAVAVGQGFVLLLGRAGYLTAFGITITPTLTPRLVAIAGASALGITLLGAGIAVTALLRVSPAALLAPDRTWEREEEVVDE